MERATNVRVLSVLKDCFDYTNAPRRFALRVLLAAVVRGKRQRSERLIEMAHIWRIAYRNN